MSKFNHNTIAKQVHENAVAHGWYDGPDRGVPELIALMHSELSEALESYRNNEPISWTGNDGKPEGIASEFADVMIRIYDASAYLGIDIDTAIREKMAYNASRPYRHGGKKA